MFLEVVYETGRMSVMEVASEEEGLAGIEEQHRRATSGEPGGPLGQPAERIAAVYVYDDHPDAYNQEQTMSADVATKELTELVKKYADKNGVVNIDQLVVGVRNLTHPMVDESSRTGFDSMYKVKEKKQLDAAKWGGK